MRLKELLAKASLVTGAVFSFYSVNATTIELGPIQAEAPPAAKEFLAELLAAPALSAAPTLTQRIVGGSFVPDDDSLYPWMVFVYSQNSSSGSSCGGALINSQWVVTAAHCMFGNQAFIIAGVKNWQSEDRVVIEVEQRINHPQYSSISSGNDIALYKLKTPVPASVTEEFVALSNASYDATYAAAGDLLTVIGWGTTSEGGNISDNLKQVEVPVVSNSDCNASLDQYTPTNIYSSHLCAGYQQGGRDSCQGDSGGPLFYSTGSQDILAGVVSFGYGCARPGLPGVYTRVSSYRNWILSNAPAPDNDSSDDDSDNDDNENDMFFDNGEARRVAGSRQSETVYAIQVPANVRVTASLSGGSGDADLYTLFNSVPTTSRYDCRPYEGGNNESCTDEVVNAGIYYVMLQGYRDYSGATLRLSYESLEPEEEPEEEPEGNTGSVSDLSGNRGSLSQNYAWTVPEGMSKVTISISGGTGDADLHVRYGSQPTTSQYDCRPYKEGNEEVCIFENPRAGTYNIKINAYRTYSGLSLTATTTP